MLRVISFASLVGFGLAVAVGCSSDSGDSGSTASGGSGQGGSSGEGGSSQGGSGATGSGGCEGTTTPTNDDFCRGDGTACPAELDCGRISSRPLDNCCVLLTEPGGNPNNPQEMNLTTDTEDFAAPSAGPPDLDCFANPPVQDIPAEIPTVTVQGVVEPFSNGCDVEGVKIEIFEVRRTGDPATDGEVGALVGSPVVVTAADPEVLEEKEGCPDDELSNRRYAYADVPMYTELLVKTSGNTPADGWRDLYTYNLYVGDGDPDLDTGAMTFERELRALADSDFTLIPTVAIGSTISSGNGAVGGEVHDCNNYRVQNAIVDINVSRAGLTYFNDDEQEPLPDVSRNQLGTGRTAIFSALDAPAGPARVSAAGLLGGEVVSLGFYDIRIFPNAVTSVTFRGLRPYQVKN